MGHFDLSCMNGLRKDLLPCRGSISGSEQSGQVVNWAGGSQLRGVTSDSWMMGIGVVTARHEHVQDGCKGTCIV